DNDLLVGRTRHVQPSDFVPPGRILCEGGRRHHDGAHPGHKGHGTSVYSHQTSPLFRNCRTSAALLARTRSSVYYGFYECSEPCSSELSDWFGEPRRHVQQRLLLAPVPMPVVGPPRHFTAINYCGCVLCKLRPGDRRPADAELAGTDTSKKLFDLAFEIISPIREP